MRRRHSSCHFSKNRGEAAVFGKVVRRVPESNRHEEVERLESQPPEPGRRPGSVAGFQSFNRRVEVRRRQSGFWAYFSEFFAFWDVLDPWEGDDERLSFPGEGQTNSLSLPWGLERRNLHILPWSRTMKSLQMSPGRAMEETVHSPPGTGQGKAYKSPVGTSGERR